MSYRDPAVAPDVMIVAFGEWIFRLDPTTGQRIWYQHISGVTTQIIRVVVVADRVLVAAASMIFCIAVEGGQLIWTAKAPVYATALAVVEGMVVIGGNGESAGFDLATGEQKWHDPFKNLGTGAVTIATRGSESGPVPHGKGVA